MNPEGLIPLRVRLDKDTRMPADSDSKAASKMDPATQESELNLRMAKGKGKGKLDTHRWPPRVGHREVPVVEEQKGGGPEYSSPEWPARRREWKSGNGSRKGGLPPLCARV